LVGSDLPGAPEHGFSQVEANDGNSNFEPNTASTLFTGKTFTHKSGSSGVSSHAQQVATNLYGDPSSLLGGSCPVDLYGAASWITTFIRRGTGQLPPIESRSIVNLSWISPRDTNSTNDAQEDAQATESNKRLDFAIDRDGFVCVAGANNGNSTVLPQLWEQSYHTISVGLVNGSHSAGFTALDVSGRIKPEIVAPDGATSFATPMVGSAAGLLLSKLSTTLPSLTPADRPRVAKALLMATATKDTVASWQNTTTRPLDLRYGAGELNVLHAYNALSAGPAAPSDIIPCHPRGWSAAAISSTAARRYHFTIPAGATSTPFCAALTWHRVITQSGGFTWNATLADLKLSLFTASNHSPVSLIAESNSPVDNVELVNASALPPGDYLFQVESNSAASTNYALAWHSLPTVTIAATDPDAREIDSHSGEITITRSGDTSLPLFVPIATNGNAVAGVDFQVLPTSITIPGGQSSVTLTVSPLPDQVAEGDHLLMVSIAADFGLVRDPSQAASVTIHDKPFDAWRFENFPPPALEDLSTSGPTADPDHDGLPNLIEYALGLQPDVPDVSPLVPLDSEGHLTLGLAKNPSATDLTWTAEVSSDLESWQPADILTNDGSSFVARDPFSPEPEESGGARFIRLRIILP